MGETLHWYEHKARVGDVLSTTRSVTTGRENKASDRAEVAGREEGNPAISVADDRSGLVRFRPPRATVGSFPKGERHP
jgi:hypothetical protein